MVNKGRILREIGNFLGTLQIWSNRMTNWGEKLGFSRLEKKIHEKSMESKITWLGSEFVEKSRSEI